MTNSDKTDLDHLRWVVRNRAKNQECALALFELLKKYPAQWKKPLYSSAAQMLVGIAFSLWRAAFLADKSGDVGSAIEHASLFLEKIILDNAIAYAQDRSAREWTFTYYVNAARYMLVELGRAFPNLVPEWKPEQKGASKERWEYLQQMLGRVLN
jgi:hypothetical protein